jgi:predicted ester cyclase
MATTLTLEQMKQFVRDHFEDFVNKRNAAVIRKNMTSDFHDHDGPGGKPTGVDGDEQMMLNMCKAMPDLHLTIEDMIAEATELCAAISGVGLTRQARRCSFMNGSTLPWTSSSVN